MSSIANDIIAEKRKLSALLREKYTVDYFQREYKWERKHIEQLLVDLQAAFDSNYEKEHTIASVNDYNNYYLGPIVICKLSRSRSIVDGQQRLTSITLLLIYLNNLQQVNQEQDDLEEITPLIFSRKGGINSYNIEVPERQGILEALFTKGEFDIENEDDPSVRNMYDRYIDIVNLFPEELKTNKLPLFIEWLKDNVIFVEILAHSNENAYTIFETMNDRGLNLTPTEMLKGYILTNIQDNDRVEEISELWKKHISNFHRYSLQEDQEFIRAWLRSSYAESIRSTSKGAENEDFEKIGTRFHTWIKDNSKKIGLKEPEAFYYFVKGDFDFYATLYTRILNAERNLTEGLETLYLSSHWSIAKSLSYPLMMAPISTLDDEETIISKLNIVSKFLDIFTVSRVVNYRSITQTSIRYTIYSLVKEIRNKDIQELRLLLKNKLLGSTENIDNIISYNYQYDNRKFIHYLFARMTFYVEKYYNQRQVFFDELMPSRRKNRYILAPIVDYDYEEYKNNFKDEDEFFQAFRLLGNHILIQNVIAEDFNSDKTINKLKFLESYKRIEGEYKSEVWNSTTLGLSQVQELDYANLKQRTAELTVLANEIWNVENI
jgi:Uncharacterized conserved protein